MKFMLNGAPTLGTMDGANVEIVEEVGRENAFIFGLSSDEVINFEQNGGYDPMEIYNNDPEIRRVVDQLVRRHLRPRQIRKCTGISTIRCLSSGDGSRPDMYFILKDFRSYARCPGAGGSGLPRSGPLGKDGSPAIRQAAASSLPTGPFRSMWTTSGIWIRSQWRCRQ